MTNRILALALLSAFLAMPASADVAPTATTLANGCIRYTMCDAQPTGSTGDCTSRANGDEIVQQTGSFYSLRFDATQSTATTFTCDIEANNQGHDDSSGDGEDMSPSSITQAARIASLTPAPDYVWITCSAIGDNAVTITMTACPLSR